MDNMKEQKDKKEKPCQMKNVGITFQEQKEFFLINLPFDMFSHQ